MILMGFLVIFDEELSAHSFSQHHILDFIIFWVFSPRVTLAAIFPLPSGFMPQRFEFTRRGAQVSFEFGDFPKGFIYLLFLFWRRGNKDTRRFTRIFLRKM